MGEALAAKRDHDAEGRELGARSAGFGKVAPICGIEQSSQKSGGQTSPIAGEATLVLICQESRASRVVSDPHTLEAGLRNGKNNLP